MPERGRPERPNRGDLVLHALRSMWWATLAIGIVAVLLGLVALFMPVAALAAIVLLAAVCALLTGLFAVIGGTRAIRHDAGGWLVLLWGLLGVGLGLYVIFEPKTGALVLFLLYGIWAVLRGAAEIIAAVRVRHEMAGWAAVLTAGVLWLALGLLFLVAPSAAAIATTMVWGALVVVIGIVTIVAAAYAHKGIKELEDDEAAASSLLQY
jgi:uncharacterized membrane protein HdeD (DUF308 family)